MIIPLTNLVAEGSTDMRWLTATQPHGANLVVASSASSHPAALRTARESYRWLLAEGLLDATWLYQALHVLVQARLELLNMHGLVDWQPAGRRLDADLGGILRLLVGRAPRGGGGGGRRLALMPQPGWQGHAGGHHRLPRPAPAPLPFPLQLQHALHPPTCWQAATAPSHPLLSLPPDLRQVAVVPSQRPCEGGLTASSLQPRELNTA